MANEVKYLSLGDVNIQGGTMLTPVNPANIPTPTTGPVLFSDSTNGNKLSIKDTGGVISELGIAGGGVTEDMAISYAVAL